MSRKDQILTTALQKNGLDKTVKRNSTLFNIILGCMQEFSDLDPDKTVVQGHMGPPVISLVPSVYDEEFEVDESKKNVKVIVDDHDHSWLHLGDSVYICEHCPAHKQL